MYTPIWIITYGLILQKICVHYFTTTFISVIIILQILSSVILMLQITNFPPIYLPLVEGPIVAPFVVEARSGFTIPVILHRWTIISLFSLKCYWTKKVNLHNFFFLSHCALHKLFCGHKTIYTTECTKHFWAPLRAIYWIERTIFSYFFIFYSWSVSAYIMKFPF